MVILMDQIEEPLPSMQSSLSGTIKTFSIKVRFVHLNHTESLYLSLSRTAFPALQRLGNVARH